jgi:hypothetical protein
MLECRNKHYHKTPSYTLRALLPDADDADDIATVMSWTAPNCAALPLLSGLLQHCQPATPTDRCKDA